MSFDEVKLATTLRAPDCEGDEASAYTDSLGYLSIGVGHLIDKRLGGELSQAARDFILNEDINGTLADLDVHLPWWRREDDVRQQAMAELCFNLGIAKLSGFVNMLAAWKSGDYAKAAAELQNSRWWGQIQESRKTRLYGMILNGESV